ncbi:hypothetical protein HYU89_04210 [Candidatus Collierbacteria bacterium]|nr:hypothetical protein [Candidatus Collierbacteria bacterium]
MIKRILPGILFFVFIFGLSIVFSVAVHLKIYSDISRETLESFQDYHNYFLEVLAQSRIAPQSLSTPTMSPNGAIPRPTKTVRAPTPPPHISEDQLWQALADYRQAQNRNHLVKEESLCVYARKRVEEHQTRYLTLKSGEASLDSHAGFERDAANESVFKETNFPAIAENLAYLPEYAIATQIIEWGWDSSSPHRNAQLSNDWTHACISGRFPFYVGIFAHR